MKTVLAVVTTRKTKAANFVIIIPISSPQIFPSSSLLLLYTSTV